MNGDPRRATGPSALRHRADRPWHGAVRTVTVRIVDETDGDVGPDGPGRRVPRRVVVAAIAVATVILVAGAAVLVTRGDGDTTTTGATTTEREPSTSRTTRRSTTTSERASTPPPTTEAGTETSTPAASTTSSTAAGTGLPPQGDHVAPDCVNGWSVPAPGTSLRTRPLDLMRRDMGVTGKFRVLEMRYFTGPEVPWVIYPRPPYVEWWYVKAHLVDDPDFRARWLVVYRRPTANGVAAVARFDTTGYRSPDWRGFIGESEPRTIEGLPGTWIGIDYDFLVGEDGEKPGLPDENVGCMDGT